MSANEAILLVDDDEDHLLVARRALERGMPGAEVLFAHDGYEALQILGIDGGTGIGQPGLRVVAILMDLRMPGLSGWELLQRIRKARLTAHVPVVVVSSSNRPEDVRQSYELGANSYVVKRFDVERPGGYLAEAARYWLEVNQPPAGIADGGRRAAE